MDCGGETGELEEALSGHHTYAEYRIFGELSLVLCDFCQADFSSYDPAFFGLPRGRKVGRERGWDFVREVQTFVAKDKYCSGCGHRLSFLVFVAKARQLNNGRD